MGRGVRFAVKLIDKGYRDYAKKLKTVGGTKPVVAVGVRGAKAMQAKKAMEEDGNIYDSPVTLVEIATIQEYGSFAAGIPERSFMRSTFKENLQVYKKLGATLGKEVMKLRPKYTIRQALGIIGEKYKMDVQAKIRSNIPPGLSLSTILARQARGIESEKTLIVTGQLVGAITYQVRMDGTTNSIPTNAGARS